MVLYCVFFVGIGSAYGLKFFTGNDYGVHFVFFILISLQQVTFSLLLSSIFSSARTAQVFSGLWVIAGGLLGNSLLGPFIISQSQPESICVLLEFFFPFFALYRGLWEMGEAAFVGAYSNTHGLTFERSRMDPGMGNVMIILTCQIILYSFLYAYLEQVIDSGAGVPKHPLFFFGMTPAGASQASIKQDDDGAKSGRNADVVAEELRTRMMDKSSAAILVRNLQKVFPGRGGGKAKVACHSLSLAVEYGECFGLLGPNGAGKSTSINMLVGFLEPTDGTAFVAGKDIRYELPEIYSQMGLCPQHDLLWETLTAREHLSFYGRLKGLQGVPLKQAVDKALEDVNLYEVGDKEAGQYSGGMKRRLSVAIVRLSIPIGRLCMRLERISILLAYSCCSTVA
jgi:ABC-type lipoprotein export system ATPase subunit